MPPVALTSGAPVHGGQRGRPFQLSVLRGARIADALSNRAGAVARDRTHVVPSGGRCSPLGDDGSTRAMGSVRAGASRVAAGDTPLRLRPDRHVPVGLLAPAVVDAISRSRAAVIVA